MLEEHTIGVQSAITVALLVWTASRYCCQSVWQRAYKDRLWVLMKDEYTRFDMLCCC